MTQSYKVLSAFEQVALQRKNVALQAQVDDLMLEFCPNDMTKEQLDRWESHQRAIGANVHDQIAVYWEYIHPRTVVNSNEAIVRFEQEEDDYVYLFLVVSIVSFLVGFVASYYHYV